MWHYADVIFPFSENYGLYLWRGNMKHKKKTKSAVLSVVLTSVDAVDWVEVKSVAASLHGAEGLSSDSSAVSLMLLFRRFFVRSTSVRFGSNDDDRCSEGHVALVVIWSTSEPGDDGMSLIYTADTACFCLFLYFCDHVVFRIFTPCTLNC